MAIELQTSTQYLPEFLTSAQYIYLSKDRIDKNNKNAARAYNYAIRNLLNGVFAIATYVAATHFGEKYGITPPIAACLLSLVSYTATRFGVGTYLAIVYAKNGYTAAQHGHIDSAVKSVAIAILGYAATTPKINEWVNKYVYSLFTIPEGKK